MKVGAHKISYFWILCLMQQVLLEKFLQMEEAFRPHRGLFIPALETSEAAMKSLARY